LNKRNKPIWKQEIGFLFLLFSPLLIFVTGATAFDWFLCVFLYFSRMFWVTAGYHRYFSHKSFQTSRWFQFVLAFMAQTSVQKGTLWWAANHRVHHKHSDTELDPHSSKLYGFWYSHIGWIMGPDYKQTLYKQIPDFAKYPELEWLNKHHLIPGIVLLIAVWITGGLVNGDGTLATAFTAGLSSVTCGFLLSTVILYHGSFSINSLMHSIGKARYETGESSKNSLILALVTLGEGWHNNHHYYQSSARQGFYWWEIDITFYILKVFSWFGLVWDIQEVPLHIRESKNYEHAKELLNQSRNKAA
jgi:stearoyl-CoA desaturase (delta-9 desaturase)